MPGIAAPLAGIRVVDFTRVLAGPYLTQMLASLGADVVKIEPPEGDPTRHQGEPLFRGNSYYFHGTNGGKQSIALDLRMDADREIALQLVAKADLLVENFRPGTLARLGISAATLEARNPELISLSISAFGNDAPESVIGRPSFDLCTQARGGTLSINGSAGAMPVRLAVPMGDLAGSFYGCIAVLAALLEREKARAISKNEYFYNNSERRGGVAIDVSLLDAQAALLVNWMSYSSLSGSAPRPVGSAHTSAAPYDVYEAGDSPFVVAVFTDRFWIPFLTAIGRLDLAMDPRFQTGFKRVAHRAALDAMLRPLFQSQPRRHWLLEFDHHGVPAEAVANISETMADPLLLSRGMLHMETDGNATNQVDAGRSTGQLARMSFPAKFNAMNCAAAPAPAVLDGDREDILKRWLHPG